MKLVDKIATKTSHGCLSKGWYESGGELYLIKGNSGLGNLEPYSEVIASRIGKLLNLNIVEYNLVPSELFPDITGFDIEHYSICKSYKSEDITQVLSICTYLDLYYGKFIQDYWSALQRSNLDLEYTYKLLLFDAFIGNQDRHLNNWEVGFTKEGTLINLPIMDNGASLLYNQTLTDLKSKWSLGVDKAKPFKKTHREQVDLIKKSLKGSKLFKFINKEYFLQEVLNINQDIFSILGEERTHYIIKYLNNRFVYLEEVMESV